MILMTRNGRKTVVTGWRAWLLGLGLFAATTALLLAIAFVLLGVAITVGAMLLVVVPVAAGVAMLALVFRGPQA